MTALTMGSGTDRVRRVAPNVLGVVLAIVVVALGWWLAERPLVRGHGPYYQAPPTASRGAAAAIMTSAGIPAVAGTGAAPLAPMPGDGLHPAEYAVRVGDAQTPAGAILRLQQIGAAAPSGTYAPIPDRSDGAYAVFTGAFNKSNDADALLRSLRAHGQLSETGGTVVRLPLAFLIERDVPAAAAAGRVAASVARGLPAYALRQADGTAWILAGAFAAAADTASLARTLRDAGLHVTLAYRTGRPF
jgi:hypothetical protein